MKKLKLFLFLSCLSLIFLVPQHAYSMLPSKDEVQKNSIKMQLQKGSDETLEAVVGTGSNVLLKMSLQLDLPPVSVDEKELEVSAKFFLTDFLSAPTDHPVVESKVKISCEWTSPECILPDKPKSFGSYLQFTDWLDKGYFRNKTMMTYDFHVNIRELAPSLAQYLFPGLPGEYNFIGTHEIENSTIKPEKCAHQATYRSERGKVNTTTATLQGTFYLNNHAYPIENHQQVFSHEKSSSNVFKTDNTKSFYHHQWIAHSEITEKVFYEEFPKKLLKDWPNAPSNKYNLVQNNPGNKEDIETLTCLDGNTGEGVDVSDGKIFKIICEERVHYKEIEEKKKVIYEIIVKDNEKKLYNTMYRNLTREKVNEQLSIENTIEQYNKLCQIFNQKNSLFCQEESQATSRLQSETRYYCCTYKSKDTRAWGGEDRGFYSNCCGRELSNNVERAKIVIKEKGEAEKQKDDCGKQVLALMQRFEQIIGRPHLRWGEFSAFEKK